MHRPNPIHPDHLMTKERLGEVCSILALGILHLCTRNHAVAGQSSTLSAETGDSSVDYLGTVSGHATPSHEVNA